MHMHPSLFVHLPTLLRREHSIGLLFMAVFAYTLHRVGPRMNFCEKRCECH